MYLSFIKPVESVPEVYKCVVDARVVGQGQERVTLSHRGHGTQPRLPTLRIPVDKLQIRLQPEFKTLMLKMKTS